MKHTIVNYLQKNNHYCAGYQKFLSSYAKGATLYFNWRFFLTSYCWFFHYRMYWAQALFFVSYFLYLPLTTALGISIFTSPGTFTLGFLALQIAWSMKSYHLYNQWYLNCIYYRSEKLDKAIRPHGIAITIVGSALTFIVTAFMSALVVAVFKH